jgi:Family of unknown function (DUF5681)
MSGVKRTSSRGDYKVGYRKPPKRNRFKPGQSGNPKGRPRGTRNFKTDVKSTLNTLVKLTRDGKSHKVSTQKAMLLRLLEKALSGDVRALDRLIFLAQAYNDDELVAAGRLSANDAHVLGIYRARVLGGLIPTSDGWQRNEVSKTISGELSALAHASETTPVKRVRIKRYRPSRRKKSSVRDTN